MLNKERFNTFVDAILAIIITIMVLDIRSPTEKNFNLVSLAQSVLAYGLTFFILWVSWYSIQLLFSNVEKISYKMYWIFALHLFLMSLYPLLTSWIGGDLWNIKAEFAYMLLGFLSFAVYHLLIEPEALKYIPPHKRPPVHVNKIINWTRIILIVLNLTIIWFFPPISLLVLVVFSLMHVREHIKTVS
ncbi:TMEM175 family protein [Leuconostoc citreum]|uniref:TMEM175 family protein n=1 Tax=Leuconostoc citreum TaxID=33964 RepID=UPI003D7FD271